MDKEKVKYWLEIADYDFETAKSMLESKRYLYVGFMCHQSIEKTLKAYYSSKLDQVPPFSHNLKHLADKVGLYDLLSEEQKDIIDLLLPLNIEARYPTYKEQLLKSLSYAKCEDIIQQTNSLKQWIEKQL
jgi:HEPN domain-containing protein